MFLGKYRFKVVKMGKFLDKYLLKIVKLKDCKIKQGGSKTFSKDTNQIVNF